MSIEKIDDIENTEQINYKKQFDKKFYNFKDGEYISSISDKIGKLNPFNKEKAEGEIKKHNDKISDKSDMLGKIKNEKMKNFIGGLEPKNIINS